MVDLSKLWREPLVHFLLIGAGLFLAFDLAQEDTGDAPNRIVVSPSQVEQLVAQYERTWLRPPAEKELVGLMENHVRDEVYYREALAMGLDQNDPQVRRRMRLKLEFILEDLSREAAPGDEVLEAFLEQHVDRFQVPAQVWFHQIYLNPDTRQDLVTDAEKMLAKLRAGAPPETLGNPTMLPYDNPAMLQSDIARRFGEAFAREVVALEPGTWTGPLYSGLGGHLVRVTNRREGHLPELAEIREQVEREYLAQRRQELKDIAYQKLREGYEVIIEPKTAADNTAGGAVAATSTEQAGQ